MSYHVKQGTATSFFVPMYASDGATRMPGITLGQVIVKAYYADGTSATVTPTAWAEKDASNAPGAYMITLPGSAFPAIPGPVLFSIFTSASDKTYREFISAVSSADELAAHTLQLRRIEEGHWKIDTGLNQLVLYSNDGTTVLQRFNLFNKSGAATSSSIYERVPTIAIP